MAPAYRWHRQFLQHLQSRHPGRRRAGRAVAAEVTGPHLVPRRAAHRVPGRVARADPPGSVAHHRVGVVAPAAAARMASDDPNLPEIADEWADYIIEGLDRSVDRTRGRDGARPTRSWTSTSSAFMADPFATIGSIYDRLGLELTAESEARMRSFLAEHGQDEHGGHKYSFAATGLDAGALARTGPPLPGVLRRAVGVGPRLTWRDADRAERVDTAPTQRSARGGAHDPRTMASPRGRPTGSRPRSGPVSSRAGICWSCTSTASSGWTRRSTRS